MLRTNQIVDSKQASFNTTTFLQKIKYKNHIKTTGQQCIASRQMVLVATTMYCKVGCTGSR